MKVTELNEERKRQGLSVAELAQRSNLPKGTVEKVLFGIVQNPRIDTMQAIEKALGISDIDPPTKKQQYFINLFNSLTPQQQDKVIAFIQGLLA